MHCCIKTVEVPKPLNYGLTWLSVNARTKIAHTFTSIYTHTTLCKPCFSVSFFFPWYYCQNMSPSPIRQEVCLSAPQRGERCLHPKFSKTLKSTWYSSEILPRRSRDRGFYPYKSSPNRSFTIRWKIVGAFIPRNKSLPTYTVYGGDWSWEAQIGSGEAEPRTISPRHKYHLVFKK